ncbi:hypothetical protein QM012_002874 [Aureobasidium pullulans]|uniref:WD40 repeat-like protein n=1 Tax=Aureobasidium pullulans TaxID=5580 RepID=A0ABR0TAS8_AURPU
MPSSNDEVFHAEDTPDEAKGNKASRKKQKKKAAKQRLEAEDDSAKDSSSEGPHLSPDLVPTLAPIAPSPPPSRSPSPPLDTQLSAPTQDLSPPDKIASPLSKVPALQSPRQQLHPFAPTSEPSPPQDGVMLGHDISKAPPRLSGAGSPLHAASLSSSPQGGIRLPQGFMSRGFSDATINAYTSTPSTKPMNFANTNQVLPYEPLPPHMPQRHFSRLAEFDFSRPVPTDKFLQAGSRGYYCGFDTWQTPKGLSSIGTSSVVVVGFEGGLEVHKVNRQKTEVLGRLEGLPGGVIDATIISWTARDDPLEHLRPLVACVIHGPVLEHDLEQPSSPPGIKEYHTVVEVYSMRTWQRVSRLFQTRPEKIHQSVATKGFTPPPPIGNISVAAEGRFILVTSGVSGEIFVFAVPSKQSAVERQPFCCLAKYWSSLQTRASSSEERNTITNNDPGTARLKSSKRAVYALSGRWLAIKPPLISSSQTTLKATTGSIGHIDPIGIASHASPAPPSLNCEVDAPFNESLISRVAKTTTREIYKGAQQGFQALKTYINRPANSNGDPAYYGSPQSPQAEHNAFPPTHAHSNEPQTSPIEPALVSIIDLEKLLERGERESKGSQAAQHTFHLNDGCSFLSFSPSGLSLLATNHIGDESRVWDLARINDARVAVADPASVGTVRLVSRFHRLSPSVVTDAFWTVHGDRVAIVTDKGTVHLYGLQSLESKPTIMLPSNLPSPGSSPREETQASAGGFMSNMRAGWQSIHGLATRPRTGSNGIVSTLGNASMAARYAGGRAVRQGLSKGLGMAAEGAHHIRHAEDNKIRLHPAQHFVSPKCVQWQHGRDRDMIATLCNGVLTMLAVKNVSHTQNRKTVVSPAVEKTPLWTQPLPTMSSDTLPPAVLGLLEPDGPHGGCAREGPHGFCVWDAPPAQRLAERRASSVSLGKRRLRVPHQDKDTNPSYMPYHRLPTVNLFTVANSSSHADETDDTWVFGLPLAPNRKVSSPQDDSAEIFDEGITGEDMEGLVGQMDETLRGQGFSKSGHEIEDQEEKLVDM